MTAVPRVLVVEDDPMERFLLVRTLSQKGYLISEASDGVEALSVLAREHPDLVLLDMFMPRLDGLGTVKRMRQSGYERPVLILTNHGSVEHCLAALDSGADEFLRKPMDAREIAARIEALLRRTKTAPVAVRLRFGADTEVDLEQRVATQRGEPVGLTRTEYALLDLLARNAGKPVSREQILTAVWGYADGSRTRTLETHIWRVRKKLGDDPDEPRWICNLPGMGYVLRCEIQGGARPHPTADASV